MHISRRSLLGASVATAVLAACSRPAGGQLGEILDRVTKDFLRESPEACTSLALSEEQAGGPYMDRLSDASKEGFLRQRAVGERALTDRAKTPSLMTSSSPRSKIMSPRRSLKPAAALAHLTSSRS